MRYYQDSQLKEYELGRACGTHGKKVHMIFWKENQKEVTCKWRHNIKMILKK
jgi:hypothetical protein